MMFGKYSHLMEGEPCPDCGEPLDIYYSITCFGCERPVPETVRSINLIRSLKWLERNGFPGIKDRIWGDLFEYYQFANDSSFEIRIGGDEETGSDGVDEFLKTLPHLYDKGMYLVEVSW